MQSQQQTIKSTTSGKLAVVPEDEESKNFVSFSQDFNEMVEKKHIPLKKGNTYISGVRRISSLSNQNSNPNHLETMGVNFQTCNDEYEENNKSLGGTSGGNLRGANSSQKFQSFMNDNDDDEFKDPFGDEETLK